MQNHLFQYWGKADEKYVGATSWHPLAYHCLDVAACGQVLLNAQPSWLEVNTHAQISDPKSHACIRQNFHLRMHHSRRMARAKGSLREKTPDPFYSTLKEGSPGSMPPHGRLEY
jgi:CRISPR-associated endonuclease/helicase Cas3